MPTLQGNHVVITGGTGAGGSAVGGAGTDGGSEVPAAASEEAAGGAGATAGAGVAAGALAGSCPQAQASNSNGGTASPRVQRCHAVMGR